MGLFDKLTGEFVDVIEWTEDHPDTMVYRFERHGNEIKYGAQLTVRASQMAVFVNEGEVADVLGPGMYTLETANLPILSTLQAWMHGAESPFKAEVYFCNTRLFTDLRWGTRNPIIMRDPEFGPVRVRAFGTYATRIDDPELFLTEVVGTDGRFTVDEVSDQLRNLIVSRFGTVVAKAGIPVLDLAANYDDLGQFLTNAIAPEFASYGLGLETLRVENISLPEAVEKALDKRTSMGVVGDLKKYTQFQAAEALANAAANPGAAGGAMGMGIGVVLSQLAGAAGAGAAGATTAPAASPPPIPNAKPVLAVFLAVDGQQTGPFDLAGLQTELAAGRMTRDTLAWMQGQPNWQAASSIAALRDLFAAVPPPIPGA
ncbi:MAG: SPFH domain-containing protein [Pseudomonadota bacterium]